MYTNIYYIYTIYTIYMYLVCYKSNLMAIHKLSSQRTAKLPKIFEMIHSQRFPGQLNLHKINDKHKQYLMKVDLF